MPIKMACRKPRSVGRSGRPISGIRAAQYNLHNIDPCTPRGGPAGGSASRDYGRSLEVQKGLRRKLRAISWASSQQRKDLHVIGSDTARERSLLHIIHPILRCSRDREVSALPGSAAGTSARRPGARTTASPRSASKSPLRRKPGRRREKQEKGGK